MVEWNDVVVLLLVELEQVEDEVMVWEMVRVAGWNE